jgi:hypothetical protein
MRGPCQMLLDARLRGHDDAAILGGRTQHIITTQCT